MNRIPYSCSHFAYSTCRVAGSESIGSITTAPTTAAYTINEARLSHLPFWGPSEGFFLIN